MADWAFPNTNTNVSKDNKPSKKIKNKNKHPRKQKNKYFSVPEDDKQMLVRDIQRTRSLFSERVKIPVYLLQKRPTTVLRALDFLNLTFYCIFSLSDLY